MYCDGANAMRSGVAGQAQDQEISRIGCSSLRTKLDVVPLLE
jgi:hypothetical protein